MHAHQGQDDRQTGARCSTVVVLEGVSQSCELDGVAGEAAHASAVEAVAAEGGDAVLMVQADGDAFPGGGQQQAACQGCSGGCAEGACWGGQPAQHVVCVCVFPLCVGLCEDGCGGGEERGNKEAQRREGMIEEGVDG